MKLVLVSAVALIDDRGHILLAQRPEGKALAGLWEFPRVERQANESWAAAAHRAARTVAGRQVRLNGRPQTLSHGIMHFKVRLRCYTAVESDARAGRAGRGSAARSDTTGPVRWIAIGRLRQLPFSSPQRQIIARLESDADRW